MKQTAVEWLEQLLFNKQGKFTKGDIEQAKEMEKQKQGYSEEEVMDILLLSYSSISDKSLAGADLRKWFEQFKKK